MLLTGKIKTLLSTGAPDYTICGQTPSALSFTDLRFKLAVGKNDGTTYTVIDTNDLSTLVVTGLPVTYTFGNYDLTFTDFTYDIATSTFQANVSLFFTGTSDVVTWERFNMFLFISKDDYQSYYNTFELYGYDIGNSSGVAGITDTTGNQEFDIVLVSNADNIDGFGRQTKAASNFITLRRPFTNEIYIYNMIGTQGDISYSTSDGVFAYGANAKLTEEEDVVIEQTVNLTADYCTSEQMAYKKVWWPTLTVNHSSLETCDECTNTLANTEVTWSLDATLVSVFNIEGVPYFLTEFMEQRILIEIINYNSEIQEDQEYLPILTYALWVADPTVFLNPTTFSFVPEEVGDNVIKVTHLFFYTYTDSLAVEQEIKFYECVNNYHLPTCHWWTVTPKDDCGGYTINNCSNVEFDLTLQMLQEDKTFADLSTVSVEAFGSTDISLSDGIYVLKMVQGGLTEYYTLPSFCTLEACMLTHLNKVLCNKVDSTNCETEDHYNFNSLLINAHSFFLALNQEMNYSYVYSSINSDKINELYTLKQFIDRFAEYCEASDSPCIGCE